MRKKTRCPHDNVCFARHLPAPESGIYNYTSEARPLFDRVFRRGQRYNQVAQPAAPWISYPQPHAPASREQPTGALNSGETVWRTPDIYTDVIVPRNFAVTAAGLFAGVLFSVAGCVQWPSFWWGIPGLTFATAETFYLIAGWHILKKDERDMRTRERLPEQAQMQTEAIGHKMSGELKKGKSTLYTNFEITDPWAWHEFCKDVHFEKARFSQNVAVKKHGMTIADFKVIVRKWVSQDNGLALIEPESIGERKTLRLTIDGEEMVRLFAEQPPTPGE